MGVAQMIEQDVLVNTKATTDVVVFQLIQKCDQRGETDRSFASVSW